MTAGIKIRKSSFEDIRAAHARVPEIDPPRSVSDYRGRVADRDHIALIAEDRGAPVGFKLGYALNATEFYSWLGGVDPAYRKHGVAQALMDRQEAMAAAAGFTIIRVRSMNRFPGMLRLLLANGYIIDGYQAKCGPDDAKILFTKSLP
jgi:ribosomal protein S18 acetylase RimI-like enzyme